MMTLIQIVQEFCRRQGLPVPANVFSNQDTQVIQINSLLNEELDDLVTRHFWPQLQIEATFNATGVQDQGALDTLAPGFRNLISDTLYSTTRRLKAQGSMSAADMERTKAYLNASGVPQYRLMQGHLYFIPGTNIPNTEVFRFMYNTKHSVADGDTPATLKKYFVKDNDTPLLDDSLILMGLRWRWKAAKGLPYAQNFDTYEEKVRQAIADSTGAPPLYMGSKSSVGPQIMIPQGNWPTS